MAGLGVDFINGLHSSFIVERGSKVLHEIACLCTCQVSDVYAGQIDDGKMNRRDYFCPICAGIGYFYVAPRMITGMLTNIRSNRNQTETGIAMPGDMSFSIEFDSCSCESTGPYRKVSLNDRITILQDLPIDSGQIIIRNAAGMGTNGLVTNLESNQDRLWYYPKASIHCQSETGQVFTENGDFILGPSKTITWINPPPDGTRISLKYTGFFEYISYQPAIERFDRDGLDIGQLIYLRKRHIAVISDSPILPTSDLTYWETKIGC